MAPLPGSKNYGKEITTLYVRPLSGKDHAQELRHDDILNHFIEFGDVTSVRLRNKPKRSYGFVKFTQPESAAKAFQTKIHTIAGCRVEIDVAHARYQDRVSLMILNDDCLLGIFSAKCLSVEDLCSVAETCRRLKEIAVEVFRRQYKKCDLNELIPTSGCRYDTQFRWTVNVRDDGLAKRILVNFGSVMSDLQIDGCEYNKRTEILDCMARFCSDSLDSLTLTCFDIPGTFADKLQRIFYRLRKFKMTRCTFEGVCKELFTDCPAMVELVVLCDDDNDMPFITEKTFPKLQHFEYQQYDSNAQLNVNFESFLSRHQDLKVLNICGCDGGSPLLQSIPDNCRQLEQLQCDVAKDSTFDLSNLGRLKQLRIDFAEQSVTRSSLGWNNLHFLVKIILCKVNVDSEFVRSLSQLKGLQELKLLRATEIHNLQRMDDMNQLAKLEISSGDQFNNFDLVRLVQRFGNLKHLGLNMRCYSYLDDETYLEIVEIVRRRSDKSKLFFRLCTGCEEDGENDVLQELLDQNRHLVIMRYGCLCHYDFEIWY